MKRKTNGTILFYHAFLQKSRRRTSQRQRKQRFLYALCFLKHPARIVQTVDWFLALVKAVQQACPPLLPFSSISSTSAAICKPKAVVPGRTTCFGRVLYVFSVWRGSRRPPSCRLEPNALAVCLLRCSEMRPLFRCRPSGSPSEAMGNTGSGNPHRPPDGDNLFRTTSRSVSAA